MSRGDRHRILLFGGTFDPPHRAHVEIPKHIARELDCDRIIYIPAAMNPLKTDAPPTADHHRLAMLRLALADFPMAELSTIELDRGGPSYFIETLRELRRRLDDDAELFFLIGADQAIEFDRWKEWNAILTMAEPVVVLRPPWTEETFFEASPPSLRSLWVGRLRGAPQLDVHASTVRERLRAGEDVSDLVVPAVQDYIRRNGVYAALK